MKFVCGNGICICLLWNWISLLSIEFRWKLSLFSPWFDYTFRILHNCTKSLKFRQFIFLYMSYSFEQRKILFFVSYLTYALSLFKEFADNQLHPIVKIINTTLSVYFEDTRHEQLNFMLQKRNFQFPLALTKVDIKDFRLLLANCRFLCRPPFRCRRVHYPVRTHPFGIRDSASNGPWKMAYYDCIYLRGYELIQVCFTKRWKLIRTWKACSWSVTFLELHFNKDF